MTKLAPIVLFAYKRPDHVRNVLESLTANAEAKSSELHVFIDGPKTEADQEKINAVKDVVKSRMWCQKVEIHASVENRGCPRQVIDTVTRFCAEHGRVIVLEDDLVLSSHFLNYMNAALERYSNEEKVMEISGYMYPIKSLNAESGFLRGSVGWGWATWARAWKYFEPSGTKLLARFTDEKMKYEYNFKNSHDYYGLLQDQVKGRIGGWDIRWAASIFFRNGLTLVPTFSLVKNIGLDGTGTNTYRTKRFETSLLDHPVTRYPEIIKETPEVFEAVANYFKNRMRLRNKVMDKMRAVLKFA